MRTKRLLVPSILLRESLLVFFLVIVNKSLLPLNSALYFQPFLCFCTMKGTSKLVMVATLVTALSLTMVLVLVLVLLAQLYCSLFLRNRRLTTTNPTSTHPAAPPLSSSSPLSSVYAQGVLRAPRSFLFPSINVSKEEEGEKNKEDIVKKQQKLQLQPTMSSQEALNNNEDSSSTNSGGECFVYISNPIYDNNVEACYRVSRDGSTCTPFETPETSPSRLEMSDDDEAYSQAVPSSCSCSSSSSSVPVVIVTPPLTPMKKLSGSVVANCCMSLRNARSSMGSSGSCSGLSSSSGSPYTSPSW